MAKEAKGTKDDPIPIKDRSEIRANLSYIIVKDKKEDADGEPVQTRRSPVRR